MTKSDTLNAWLNRHFALFIYLVTLGCELFLLYQGRGYGLFAAPVAGMDQLSMLQGAEKLASGVLPGGDYRYSYAYTLLLALFHGLTGGNLVAMRVLQAVLTALIPVFVYRLGRRLRLGRMPAQLGALCYLFYAPALLISVDFLRAAPLALSFLLYADLLLSGFYRKSTPRLLLAGLMGGLCILGRENFAAVVFLPLFLLFLPKVRRRIGFRRAGGVALLLLLPALAASLFNGVLYGSFQPLPGNSGNIMRFYHGEEAAHSFRMAAESLLAAVPRQFAAFLSSYELPNSLSVYAHRELIPFLRVFPLTFNLLTGLALLGVWRCRRNPAVWLLSLLILAYMGSMLFFTVFYRFRIPAVPLLAVLAGGGLGSLLEYASKQRWKPFAFALLFLAVYFAVTYVPPDSRRTVEERGTVARVLTLNERYLEAEEYIARMQRDGLDMRPDALFLAHRLHQAGETARAREVAERFLKK